MVRAVSTDPHRLFDAYMVVDWSAQSEPCQGANSIWIGHSEWVDGTLVNRKPVNPPTRSAAVEEVAKRLKECVKSGLRVLIGFDCPYGYPRGFGSSLFGGSLSAEPPWLRTWKHLGELVTDDACNRSNRFEVAATLNQQIGAPPGPFWGYPKKYPAEAALSATMRPFPHMANASISLPRYRHTEQRLRDRGKNVQETWKLFGAGSVGSQALLGIPRVLALRQHESLAGASAVWPFETGFTPEPTLDHSIIHAEVWPGVIECSPGVGQVRDEAQVYALARCLGERDGERRLASWFDRPSGPSNVEVEDCVSEEGWILGSDSRYTLDQDTRRYLRDELRDARARAFEDAEGFQPVIVALERMGAALTGEVHSLGAYEHAVNQYVANSLGAGRSAPSSETPFPVLYELVRRGRNDAAHQGAYARLLTQHAIAVALVVEDALMAGSFAVRDFMVRNPISVLPWQPVAAVRQLMLVHSFSYLPILVTDGDQPAWRLLSDLGVAQHLRDATDIERRQRLAAPVGEAIRSGGLRTEPASTCHPEDPVSAILTGWDRRISLVLEPGTPQRLCGVITPFDLL
jgi:precorrin-8X/cobalt-precorrin-8 methylmutase